MIPLSHFLERLFQRYHRRAYLDSDPLEFVHRFEDAADQEVVAILAALLAYGNVLQIRRSVQAALDRIVGTGLSPAAFAEACGRDRQVGVAAFRGWVHRFNTGVDLSYLFALIGKSRAEYGSVGTHFSAYLSADAPDFSVALSRFIEDWRACAAKLGARRSSSFHYLLTSPADGSCCKRWCMLLRWMGRKGDELDTGLWTALQPRQLILPLDTHTARISRYLGLTRRKQADWKAALEVTASLRQCDPEDPTRYDFALARLGILDVCQGRYRPEICGRCDLLPVCQLARDQAPRAARALPKEAAR